MLISYSCDGASPDRSPPALQLSACHFITALYTSGHHDVVTSLCGSHATSCVVTGSHTEILQRRLNTALPSNIVLMTRKLKLVALVLLPLLSVAHEHLPGLYCNGERDRVQLLHRQLRQSPKHYNPPGPKISCKSYYTPSGQSVLRLQLW